MNRSAESERLVFEPKQVNRGMTAQFDYGAAFSRNIGWVSRAEQEILRSKRVAIAGLGGVGGQHLLTLARLGIQNFNIADLDVFDIVNFNRQIGADIHSVGQPKIEKMAELVTAINPDADLRLFPQGVTPENTSSFLADCDLYVDGLDFFVIDTREMVFDTCSRLGIPAITAAPLGMGTAFLAFLPGKMTFEEYFRTKGHPVTEKLLRFLVGLSPRMFQMPYLVDPTTADFHNHKGPSTMMGCVLSSGVIGAMTLKVLLGRGDVPAAPRGVHFDAYRNRFVKTWRPAGMNNPLQRLILYVVKKKLAA